MLSFYITVAERLIRPQTWHHVIPRAVVGATHAIVFSNEAGEVVWVAAREYGVVVRANGTTSTYDWGEDHVQTMLDIIHPRMGVDPTSMDMQVQ